MEGLGRSAKGKAALSSSQLYLQVDKETQEILQGPAINNPKP